MTIIGFDNFDRKVSPVAFALESLNEPPNTITIVRDTSSGREGLKQQRYGVKFTGPKMMAGKRYDKLSDVVKDITSGKMSSTKEFLINSYWSKDKEEVFRLKDNKFYLGGDLKSYASDEKDESIVDAAVVTQNEDSDPSWKDEETPPTTSSCESGYHLDEDEESETYGECIKDDNTITYVIIGGIALAAIVMFSR